MMKQPLSAILAVALGLLAGTAGAQVVMQSGEVPGQGVFLQGQAPDCGGLQSVNINQNYYCVDGVSVRIIDGGALATPVLAPGAGQPSVMIQN